MDDNKGEIKKNKEIWNKIKYLIDLENNGSGKYDNKHMKIKFNLHNSLSLKQKLEMHNVVVINRSVFMITINIIPKYF